MPFTPSLADTLARLRKDLEPIYRAAIDAVSPRRALLDHCSLDGGVLEVRSGGAAAARYDLDKYERILVVGAGKATAPMAAAAEELLGERISGGVICVKHGYTEPLGTVRIIEAAHPVPDGNGLRASGEILHLLEGAGEKDLVISLISGGGSSLLPIPPRGVTLEEKRTVTDLLLKSGVSIHEMNAVRKHLSLIKGGRAAAAAWPATVLNLMISDVVGDDPSVIASGPFVPDGSTFWEAGEILRRFDIIERVPGSVRAHLADGAEGKLPETPSVDDPCFARVTNLVIASNMIALEAARGEAQRLGYRPVILSSEIEGDTAVRAGEHAVIAGEIFSKGVPAKPPCCVLSGGETTVKVTGDGLGGRNMEFALRAAPFIEGLPVVVASVGTDGSDGPTDAAGAVAAGDTLERARAMGIDMDDYAVRNDSYHFFRAMGDLIVTGPTNTNVMDVRIILAG